MNEWISVEDRLPDNAHPCVVRNPLGYYLAWNTNRGVWLTDQAHTEPGKGLVIYGVTPYMPLPQPPEGDDVP